MFNLGNLLAPIIAGLLQDNYGYRFTCDIMMILSLLYMMLLLGVFIFSTKKSHSKVENNTPMRR